MTLKANKELVVMAVDVDWVVKMSLTIEEMVSTEEVLAQSIVSAVEEGVGFMADDESIKEVVSTILVIVASMTDNVCGFSTLVPVHELGYAEEM